MTADVERLPLWSAAGKHGECRLEIDVPTGSFLPPCDTVATIPNITPYNPPRPQSAIQSTGHYSLDVSFNFDHSRAVVVVAFHVQGV